MGWFSRFFGSSKSKKNIASQDLCKDDFDEETERAIAISICEDHLRKGKKKEEEEKEKIQFNEAIKESLKIQQDFNHLMKKEDTTEAETEKNTSVTTSVADKQLDKAAPKENTLQENCDIKQQIPKAPRLCDGCNLVIEENGTSVNILGGCWHPQCFCCLYCHKPISVDKIEELVSNRIGHFHRSCCHKYCYVCEKKFYKGYLYTNHDVWKENYCIVHDSDGTPKCCSCERLEPKRTSYVMFEDGRRQCVECMGCALMDTNECQNLYIDMHEFYEGLNMKIPREFPLFLVELEFLNKAAEQEKIGHNTKVIRGLCMSDVRPEQTVEIVSKGPKRGQDNKLIDMVTESRRIIRNCEAVTAIVILYGFPRLLTGSILAHEMLHAWFRINGCNNLNREEEEGLCQVLAHMWLDSHTFSNTDVPSSSTSTSSSTSSSTSYKKGEHSTFEKKFVEFCKYQIETNKSKIYGDGFKIANEMVQNSSIQEILLQRLKKGKGIK